MEIRYVPTVDDYRNWLRASSEPLWALVTLGLLVVLILFWGIFLTYRDLGAVGWLWVAAAVLLGIYLCTGTSLRARHAFNRDSSPLGEVVWTFDVSGTTTSSTNGRGELRWQAYEKYKETDRVFLLVFRSGRSLAIPKRVMSTQQVTEMRTVLDAHIRQRKSAASPPASS